VSGNESADILLIAFREDATSGYDRFRDADKWESYSEAATEAWTVSSDMKKLTQNILPTLGNTHVSVPMSYECHADGEYTITASDIESFESNVEIYLEDLVSGGEWYDLVQNNIYTFTGSPDDPEERFVVHFFGVTGLDDQDAISAVQIYSHDHNAYIVNKGNEMIEEYVVYDMMGRELQRGTLPNSTVNKVFIGEVSGYYVVKVLTGTRFYSEKIYINR
jgi:hypothetical protein